MAASSRSRASCAAASRKATRSSDRAAREARIAGLVALRRQPDDAPDRGAGGRDARLRPARRHRHRRLLRGRQGAAERDRLRRAARAGLRLRGPGQGPQGRRAADERDRTRSSRRIRRSILEHKADIGEMRLLGQGEMHLRVAFERLALALPGRRSRPASPRSAIARPSRRRPARAAGTRSRPAATASSATP